MAAVRPGGNAFPVPKLMEKFFWRLNRSDSLSEQASLEEMVTTLAP
jgi:hypothetical protein